MESLQADLLEGSTSHLWKQAGWQQVSGPTAAADFICNVHSPPDAHARLAT